MQVNHFQNNPGQYLSQNNHRNTQGEQVGEGYAISDKGDGQTGRRADTMKMTILSMSAKGTLAVLKKKAPGQMTGSLQSQQ